MILLAITFLLGTMGCSARREGKDPEKILRDMLQAKSDIHFTGTKCFEQKVGDQFFRFRMKITCRGNDKTRVEFLEPYSKKGQVIVQQGKNSWRLGSPATEPVNYRQRRSHQDIEIRNLALLLQNYRLHYLGSEEVAKRVADIVQILSKANPSIQRHIWVDTNSRFPLKSEEVRRSGPQRGVRRFYYEQIDFAPIIPETLFAVPMPQGSCSALPQRGRETLGLEEAKRMAPFAIQLPSYLPAGFALEQISWVERSPAGFLHFHYSDGLQAISLFEENAESFHPASMAQQEAPFGGVDKIYCMHDQEITILHRHWDGTHATLVGELEGGELVKMISSLK